MRKYSPNKKNGEILDRAMEHIKSVPYRVSLRWVFYRLLQEGYYSEKDHYLNWKSLASVARKRFYDRWNPNTLVDDTRGIEGISWVYYNEVSLREYYFTDLPKRAPVYLDHFTKQPEVIIICFEARTMADQFRYYTRRIDLVPFGGDPSIHLKWRVAKWIESEAKLHDKPIRVLYFGDYDLKGQQIGASAMKDVQAWCDVDFDVTNCGLTLDQAIEYQIPENPDKPNEYQWEALDDIGASEIIGDAISAYIDDDIIDEILEREKVLSKEFKNRLKKI